MLLPHEGRKVSAINSEAHLKTPVLPGSGALRRALRGNLVSFPARIPILLKAPPADMQWSWADIAVRFNVPKHQIKERLNEWSARALALGHIQIIDPQGFAASCQVDVEYGTGEPASHAAIERCGAWRREEGVTHAVV